MRYQLFPLTIYLINIPLFKFVTLNFSLSQCKLLQDKLTTLLFLETISLSIKTTWGDDIPNISTVNIVLNAGFL